MAKNDKEKVKESDVAKTEEQDHADNGAAAEAPVAVEGRRDGNGALVVN